jgi:cytochrome c oxidase subunit III
VSSAPATTSQTGHRQDIPLSLFGMVLFISSEVMFFGGFFGAYFDIRASNSVWPPAVPHIEPLEIWPIAVILTVVLVTSSFTMQAGLSSIKRGDNRGLIRWLQVTLALGAIFLTLQLYDYSQLGFGINEGIFGTTFYTLTGFHGAHVFGGTVGLTILLARSLQGQFSGRNHIAVEAISIYWHFVDVVWIALFTTLYFLR